MIRSIKLIQSVHTVIFVILTVALAVLLYEVILDRVTALSWAAVVLLTVEGLILLANGWRCPLTVHAEAIGSAHGEVVDIFLPKWFADHVFQIYGSLFGVAILLLLVRLWG